MTIDEAKIFIQNAMEQSRNALAELMLIMPKVFAAKRKSLGEYYSNLENCKKEIQACEVAVKALEEVQQYRAIGTPEECRAAMKKQNSTNKELESHDEKHILECCISLMQEMVNEFAEWYRWQHGEDAIEELDKEERFCFRKSYFRIVQELFLLGTTHSGGTSTRAKCEQLGVDSAEEIEFDWSDEE